MDMKLSISLPDEAIAALDRFVSEAGLASRSAGLHVAIRRLPDRELQRQYAEAYDEWEASGDAALWESTVGDGITREAW